MSLKKYLDRTVQILFEAYSHVDKAIHASGFVSSDSVHMTLNTVTPQSISLHKDSVTVSRRKNTFKVFKWGSEANLTALLSLLEPERLHEPVRLTETEYLMGWSSPKPKIFLRDNSGLVVEFVGNVEEDLWWLASNEHSTSYKRIYGNSLPVIFNSGVAPTQAGLGFPQPPAACFYLYQGVLHVGYRSSFQVSFQDGSIATRTPLNNFYKGRLANVSDYSRISAAVYSNIH